MHSNTLATDGGFQWHFQILARVPQGVLELHTFRIDLISSLFDTFDHTSGHK